MSFAEGLFMASHLPESALKHRTLINLYNALNVWRGVESIKVTPAAADFAPRLNELRRSQPSRAMLGMTALVALIVLVCHAHQWRM